MNDILLNIAIGIATGLSITLLAVVVWFAPYTLSLWFSMKGVYLRARTAELKKIINSNR